VAAGQAKTLDSGLSPSREKGQRASDGLCMVCGRTRQVLCGDRLTAGAAGWLTTAGRPHMLVAVKRELARDAGQRGVENYDA
jgi:hypothetical protein